jgi:ubiquinone/menaquinone biosynthesis C-methylase UbiE
MASRSHTNIVQQEFTAQASIWSGSVPTHLQELISTLDLKPGDIVLDVAAGSCRVSRAIAPWVKHVTAVELTEAMLDEGKKMARKEKLTNITFKLGAAENLEFAADSFDLTITRYSFHHFVEPELVLKEMVRVTKPGGRVIVIDILSPPTDELAETYNSYERLRDPSHTKSPMLNQLREWYAKNKLQIVECHTEEAAQELEGWLGLPSLAEQVKARIRKAIELELAGGPVTGLQPFVEAGQIKFKVGVARLVGEKRSEGLSS